MQKKNVIKLLKKNGYIKICKELNCQPGDIMEYIPEDK